MIIACSIETSDQCFFDEGAGGFTTDNSGHRQLTDHRQLSPFDPCKTTFCLRILLRSVCVYALLRSSSLLCLIKGGPYLLSQVLFIQGSYKWSHLPNFAVPWKKFGSLLIGTNGNPINFSSFSGHALFCISEGVMLPFLRHSAICSGQLSLSGSVQRSASEQLSEAANSFDRTKISPGVRTAHGFEMEPLWRMALVKRSRLPESHWFGLHRATMGIWILSTLKSGS